VAGLACVVQGWLIGRAVVPAQDSVRYLTVAQTIARDGLLGAIRTQQEQPLFPTLVWLTHEGLTHAGIKSPNDWAASLQLAAALPLVLAVVPVYLLFCCLVGHRAAVAGAVLFSMAGNISRLGADGLADSTHLLFFVLALWAAAAYFAGRDAARPAWLALAGSFTGIALLARAEAVVLPLAVAATIAWNQWQPRRRQSFTAACVAATVYTIGLIAVLTPFLAACHVSKPDAIVTRVLGRQGAVETRPLNLPATRADFPEAIEQHWFLDGAGWLSFGRKDFSTTSRFHGWSAAVAELIKEFAQAFQYWIGALAIVGLWRLQSRAVRPADRLAQFTFLGLAGGSLFLAVSSGYLSNRHVLPALVVGLGPAGVGVVELARWLARLTTGLKASSWTAPMARRCAIATAALACLPALTRPLHASRLPHRDAADWLARNAQAHDVVLDSRGWTALYTGRTTYRYDAAQTALVDPKLAYVVVEQEELEAESRRGETLRLLVAQAAEPLARFAAPGARPGQDVVVHRWYPDRFQQLEERLHAR
jgi:hypothetical protein